MSLQRIAAFSNGTEGGNPAGVLIADSLPDQSAMQAIAKDVGYSETVFAAPDGDAWRVRYFSPQAEVPFCGHATIALGVALGRAKGAGRFDLNLLNGPISVVALQTDQGWTAELQSPVTWSEPLPSEISSATLDLFGLTEAQLDMSVPPTLAFAGVRHAVIGLRDRGDLARMAYDFDAGVDVMTRFDLTTISLIFVVGPQTIISRNAFAIGGVVEDPATGAAAAALGGALVDMGWAALLGGGSFTINQGDDMGVPSVLSVRVTGVPGDRVWVSGAARDL